MNAQAEQMKEAVKELVLIVGTGVGRDEDLLP